MTNPNIARMLDQEAYDRARAMQKVYDRNAELEAEGVTFTAITLDTPPSAPASGKEQQ